MVAVPLPAQRAELLLNLQLAHPSRDLLEIIRQRHT
jgi:hypothetical protein